MAVVFLVPPLRSLFKLEPLTLMQLGRIVGLALIPLLIAEARKLMGGKKESGAKA